MTSQTISTSRKIAWMIWIIASIFYAYQYVLRVMPNIILNDIMERFQIDAAILGQFSGVYYLGYALLHLPVGMMLDRFGPRKIMSGCILLTVLGLSPLLFASHWAYPVFGRFLIGLGSSAAILGLFKIVRMAFKQEHFTRMLSFSVMIGLLGAIYGGGPVNYLRSTLGYEPVVYLFAGIGIFLAAVTYWLVPHMASAPQTTALSDLKEVLSNPRVILSCIFAGLMVGPLEGFADVWGTAFLKQNYGLESTLAASLPSLIFMGMCFGSPLLNLVAEKVGNHLLTIIGASVVMTLCFVSLLFYSLSSGLISLNFVLIGACSAYQILAIYKASTYVREHVAGLTTAIANMIIMVFGYAFHTTMGTIINSLGGPQAPEALFYGVMVIPAGLAIGGCGFILLFIQDKKAVTA